MFEPYTAFRRLDQSRSGELTVLDISDFLADNKIFPTQAQKEYVFRRLDVNHDGRITYPE